MPTNKYSLPSAVLHLGNVDVEETDRVALELRPLRLITFDIRQARDAMPLQAAAGFGKSRTGIMVIPGHAFH